MLNTMTRWTPNASYFANGEPFFRLIDNFLSNEAVGAANGEEIANRNWVPPVDILETPEAFRLSAELPGLTRDDIQITLEHNVLRLTGERKFEKDAKKESYQRIERVYGSFSRSFSLPHQVNSEGVAASFENGVLTVTVPKAETAKPRKISIS